LIFCNPKPQTLTLNQWFSKWVALFPWGDFGGKGGEQNKKDENVQQFFGCDLIARKAKKLLSCWFISKMIYDCP